MVGILIAIAVGVLVVLFSNRAAAPSPKSYRRYTSYRRVCVPGSLLRPRVSVISHVLSFAAINALGLASTLLSAGAVDGGWSWWFAIPLFFGWLMIWGFAVNPVVYPGDYLAWIKAQKKNTEPAYICHGLAAVAWLLVHLVTLAPMLSVS